jgi:hypothetical protein
MEETHDMELTITLEELEQSLRAKGLMPARTRLIGFARPLNGLNIKLYLVREDDA